MKLKFFARKFIALLLVFSISYLYVPTRASFAAALPVGQYVVSGASSPTNVESTIFSGDIIRTVVNQRAAVTLMNASLLNMAGSTTLRLERHSGDYFVDLVNGQLTFSSSRLGREGLKIQASGVEVLTPPQSSARGKVVTTDKYILVSALSGALQVVNQGKASVVNEGDSSVFATTAATNEPTDDKTLGAGRRLEMDTNRAGFDYKTITLTEDRPGLCQAECDKDPACKAFTFVKPAMPGAPAQCRLKSGVPKPTADSCCISGVKGTAKAAAGAAAGGGAAGAGTGAAVGGGGLFGLGMTATVAIIAGAGAAGAVIAYEATKGEASPARP